MGSHGVAGCSNLKGGMVSIEAVLSSIYISQNVTKLMANVTSKLGSDFSQLPTWPGKMEPFKRSPEHLWTSDRLKKQARIIAD